MTMKIGFIGTGIMGSRMVKNLLAGGYAVTVHNRTSDKTGDLIERGATWATTPADVGHGADMIITMLAHPQAVEEMALNPENGFLNAMKPNSIWIDCSTVNPEFARRMGQQAHLREVRFMDAPVAGSKMQAEGAQLIFFVGGDSAILDTCREILMTMGKQINHVGEIGFGNALKLVLNHMLATSMVAFAEGLAFGESLGLSQAVLLNSIIGSAVAPPYLAGKRQKIETDQFDADFPLRWMQKDMQMVSETAFQTGVSMPIANITKEVYQLATRYGFGDSDFSAIYAFLKGQND
ncbi:MAG: NAD(P)-dependent oxidoreductase [bacterium]|nr:NAD(P)-dependent oxidoreductase [bacterium]